MALDIYGFIIVFGIVMYYLHQPKKAGVEIDSDDNF